MPIQRYDDIIVWRKSIDLTQRIYALTAETTFYRDRSLVDQMRRSAVSIGSNIAEGFERNNNKEFIRYLLIAKGSAGELRTQLIIAQRIGFISQEKNSPNILQTEEILSSLGSFISYLKTSLKKRANPPTRKRANPSSPSLSDDTRLRTGGLRRGLG
jgi:four helix bundle protein